MGPVRIHNIPIEETKDKVIIVHEREVWTCWEEAKEVESKIITTDVTQICCKFDTFYFNSVDPKIRLLIS